MNNLIFLDDALILSRKKKLFNFCLLKEQNNLYNLLSFFLVEVGVCCCSTFLIILRFKNQTILVNFYFFDQMGIFCKMRQNFKFSLYFFVILLKEIFKHMKMLLKVTKRWNYKISTICLGPGIWSKSIFFSFPRTSILRYMLT